MPTYSFTARDANGNAHSGVVTAASVDEVTLTLRREGKYPISVTSTEETAQQAKTAGRRGIKIPRADVVQLSNQLAIMVETGVPLTEALECIGQQTEKPKVKALVEDVIRTVHSGTDLSTALSRHDRSFPRLYVALIRASEKSGMMAKLLV